MNDEEEMLRQGLRDLAELDGGRAGGLTPVESFLAKAHRARARRRVAAVACAVVLVAGGSGLAVRLTDQTPGTADPSTAASVANDPPLRLGPTEPKIGVAYPYDLVQSCGLKFAVFGGGKWASTGRSAKDGSAAATSELTRHGDRVSGRMTLISEDVARFDFGSGPMKQSLTFHPVSGGGHCPILPPPNPDKPPVLEQSPKEAVDGFWYPHDLYVHCGLRFTGFDGRGWITVRDYAQETGIDGSGRHTIVTGLIKMSGDTLRFESPGLAPIEFRPTTSADGEPPMCS
ncbi:hypothetical protein [Streptomyces sp. NPDC020681]|uniref:hypothetical protein n=1 Tax=Streptomyces sp. NPDC020681 TaxID=3365083 RepID=UPI0037B7C0CF